jgi:plastocyanin
MRKLIAAAFAMAILSTGCLGAGGDERTIRVDYSHDEFPSFVAKNFPRRLAVHPGTELVFRQTWTGEPHSVTGGTLVDELLEEVRPYIEKSERGEPIPEDPPKKILDLEKRVAWSIDHESEDFDFIQTGAQPCYLDRGEPRKDGKPCTERDQPVFNGKQSFYNSGLIPYAGAGGNEYRVQLADNIDPGSYWFFCNYHGEFQSTEVVVQPASEDVPTAEETNRLARKEVAKVTGGFEELVDDASDDNEVELDMEGQSINIEGNFAGLFDPKADLWHSINAFIPKRMRVRADEPITWNLVGFHTISFGVPDYFPIFTFEKGGTIKRNPKLDPTAGGAKKFDIPEEERYDEKATEPVAFDGGTYDGTGFWSSGTIDASPYIEYTMRITKPGTYRYACLIHPPMVGTVEVT